MRWPGTQNYELERSLSARENGAGFRAIEFFAGIGGFATAWPACEILLAIDVNALAERIYRLNHPHRYLVSDVESISLDMLRELSADLWWLSPPCQPYSRRGRQRDLADPRARSLVRMIDIIEACRPHHIALENVVGFSQSQALGKLQQTLFGCGYRVQTLELCPTQLGWPNRRPRFYLLASLGEMRPWQTVAPSQVSLSELGLPMKVESQRELCLAESEFERFEEALDRVDPANSSAVTACFAGSYGKTIIRSGSYVLDSCGYRRFAPREVARLLGFADDFRLQQLSLRQAWKLLGNSLSIPAVRYVLGHLVRP